VKTKRRYPVSASRGGVRVVVGPIVALDSLYDQLPRPAAPDR
jgi:hypothetical protein